ARRGALGRPVEAPGRLRLLGPDEPAKVLPAIYDRYRRAQPGELGRPPGRWQAVLHDPCERREGATAYFFVVHEDDAGEADGYVTYRMAQAEVAAHHANRLLVRELVSADPLARAALWRYCLDVDLVASVQFGNAPVDDPVRWMLADP